MEEMLLVLSAVPYLLGYLNRGTEVLELKCLQGTFLRFVCFKKKTRLRKISPKMP